MNPKDDLLLRKAGLALWGVPALAVLAGLFSPAARVWLWTPAFLVAGAGCLYNARTCGRLHCRFTGPLFLVCAIATVAVGSGKVAMNSYWIPVAAVLGTAVSWGAESLLGRYGADESC